jgi:carbamoylphosphate synthase large subunit
VVLQQRGVVEVKSQKGTTLVVGPGSVNIGLGSCFQYIAARACRHLREMGFRVLILEDNPATLMDMGGAEEDIFIEPPAPEVVESIVMRNGVESIWYNLGAKRGWKLALRLAGEGWYEKLGLSSPGWDDRTLWLCGDRTLLRETLEARGIANPAFLAVGSLREGQEAAEKLGFPLVVRPHFSCGGWGAGMAYNLEEYPLLLEEAMRESLTGEVLVEEALLGWRKYIVMILRDCRSNITIPGIIEQVEPLPRHDEDAILIFPPLDYIGSEEAYALRSIACEVAESLDLVGLAEIKLAVNYDWEALHVIDVNPQPWRSTQLLEIALGVDLLRTHLDLAMGGSISGPCLEMGSVNPSASFIAIPRSYAVPEESGEGYLGLGCGTSGKRIFVGTHPLHAIEVALRALELAKCEGSELEVESAYILEDLRKRMAARKGKKVALEMSTDEEALAPICLSRVAQYDPDGGVLLLAGDEVDPAAGYEMEVNCIQALHAWKDDGGKAVLYTPNPFMALLAVDIADAVFLGPVEERAVSEAARVSGVHDTILQFGGASALRLMEPLKDSGLELLGCNYPNLGGGIANALEGLKSAGVSVADYEISKGLLEGVEILHKGVYPILAMIIDSDVKNAQCLIYTLEDGEKFLRKSPEASVLWREVKEEDQEIQVEAVAGINADHLAVLWEQLDEAGICSADGLAVYPPFYLTSEQTRVAMALAAKAIDVLGAKGNLYMRMFIGDGNTYLYDFSIGASANLPFISRASSLPLAAYGILALGGRDTKERMHLEAYSTVRAPLIPYREIAGSDILPSPQRRSTGAVIGVASNPGTALAKALWSEGLKPQLGGKVFLSVANREKRRAVLLGRELQESGYLLMATRGTSHALTSSGIEVETINKLREGRPNILDYIRNGKIGMVINIPRGKHPHSDGFYIRAASARHGVPCITNMEVALALARGLREAIPRAWEVNSLVEYGRLKHEVKGG